MTKGKKSNDTRITNNYRINVSKDDPALLADSMCSESIILDWDTVQQTQFVSSNVSSASLDEQGAWKEENKSRSRCGVSANKSMKPRIDVRLGLCDWFSNQHVDVSNSQTTLSHYKRWSFKSSALEDAHLSSNIRCGHGSWRESVAEIEPTSSFRSQKQRYENVIECVDCKIFWHWVLTQSH